MACFLGALWIEGIVSSGRDFTGELLLLQNQKTSETGHLSLRQEERAEAPNIEPS